MIEKNLIDSNENLEKEFNKKIDTVKKELGTDTNNYKKPKKPTQQELLDKHNEELTNISFELLTDLLQFSFSLIDQTYKNRSGNYLNNDLLQLYLKIVDYRRKIQGKVGQVKVSDREDVIKLKKDFLNSIKNTSTKLKNPYLKELLKKLK